MGDNIGDGAPTTGTHTYSSDWRQCPTCKGTGINPVANYLLCPKCNGETVVKTR